MAEIKGIRNVALVGHAGSGKTSLAEALLFYGGAISKLGSVAQGTTASDYHPDEIERRVSINTSCLFCSWQGVHINFLDAPGYADFLAEVLMALAAVDSALVVVDATKGVEVSTERAWQLLNDRKLPRLIVVTKLDHEQANFDQTLGSIREAFGSSVILLEAPKGAGKQFAGTVDLLGEGLASEHQGFYEKLVEAVAEQSDELLERFVTEGTLPREQVVSGIAQGIKAQKLVPILLASSTNEQAIKSLLEAIVKLLPALDQREPLVGTHPSTGESVTRKPLATEPLLAQVFKTIADPYVGQLSVFRVFSGTLNSDSSFFNVSTGTKERIGKIFRLQGKSQTTIASVSAGDIAAVAKLKDTHTGNTLTDEAHPMVLEAIAFPDPMLSIAIKPKTRTDEEKISDALQKLAVEDPTFRVSRDPQTKDLIVSGMGDLHLAVMTGRLTSRFGVQVQIGLPKVAYKETVAKKVQVQGRYKRQTGGRGQFGDVWIEVEPLPRGGGFEFINKIFGGAVPRNYIPAVEKGVRTAMQDGVLAGYPIVDVRVTLYDGSYHPVDSSDLAFQISGSMALRKAAEEAHPVLLEPIMEVEVTVPEETLGTVTGDLNGRRGRVLGIEAKSKYQVVKAQVPLAEMLKYASDLKSVTGGRGSYTMKFSHYEEVPAKIAQPIIAQAQAARAQEGEGVRLKI